jgi:hypothetical protein
MKYLLKYLLLSTILVASSAFACCQVLQAKYDAYTIIPGMVVIQNQTQYWANCTVIYVDAYGSRPIYFQIAPLSVSSPIPSNFQRWACN